MGLVVKTQIIALVKDTSKKKGYKVASVSEDLIQAADEKMRKIIEDAVARAHSDNRKTLMARDL